MFHRPNHRPEMFLTEYLTDRQPLNPYQWIDQAPLAWMSHTRSERSGVPGCYRSFDRCVRSGWPAT